MIKVEEKLFQNRYRVDTGRPHIDIADPELCRVQCKSKPCTICCPAACYTAEGDGRVTLITDGCLECGPCQIACIYGSVKWKYPGSGFGVQYRFG